MGRPTESEEERLEAGARSSAEGFAALYRHFERSTLGFFMRATGRADLAADLTAETFARALESIAAYDPVRGRGDQWLFGIARNVLGSSYRQRRVDAAARARLGLPTLILDDHAAQMISRLTEGDGEATLALEQLTGPQRLAIRRTFSKTATTRRSLGSSNAPRRWCARESAVACARYEQDWLVNDEHPSAARARPV